MLCRTSCFICRCGMCTSPEILNTAKCHHCGLADLGEPGQRGEKFLLPSHHGPEVQQPPAAGVAGLYRHHLPKGHCAPNTITLMRHSSVCPLGLIQLLQLSSPRSHFRLALIPHAHVPHLISEGADGLSTEDPTGLGSKTKPFLSILCGTKQVHPSSLSTGRGDIWFANQGGDGILWQP